MNEKVTRRPIAWVKQYAKQRTFIERLARLDPGDSKSLRRLQRHATNFLSITVAGGSPQVANSYPECCLIWLQNGPTSVFAGSGVWLGGKVVLTCNHLFDTVETPCFWRISIPVDSFANREQPKFRATALYRRPDAGVGGGADDLAILILDDHPKGLTPVALASNAIFKSAVQNRTKLVDCGFGAPINGTYGIKLASPPGGWLWDQTEVARLLTLVGPIGGLQNFATSHELIALGLQDTSLVSSCEGDSGGPLYVIHPDESRSIVGITSRFVRTDSCGTDEGCIFTRVDAHLPWIRTIAAQHGLTIP